MRNRALTLDAQRKTLQARLGKQERARDTRRKILLGALVLHRLEKSEEEFAKRLGDWLRRKLPGFLTRDEDRALFTDLLDARAHQQVIQERPVAGAAADQL